MACHDIYTNFHTSLFSRSKPDRQVYTDSMVISEAYFLFYFISFPKSRKQAKNTQELRNIMKKKEILPNAS
jgi:hypothetical protein